MKPHAFIRLLAGSLVLLSLALAQLFSPWWLLLTAFVGVNLIQSAFSGFCPPEMLYRKLTGQPSSSDADEGSCCGQSSRRP